MIKKLEPAGLLVVAYPAAHESPVESVTKDIGGPALQDEVTVFISGGKLQGVLKRLHEYASTPEKPKNEQLINRIGGFQRATVQMLWTDAATRFPKSGEFTWWEIWLRADAAGTTLKSFVLTFCQAAD